MNYTSARVRLAGDVQAALAELASGVLEERGRGFSSDQEAWAELKKRLENNTANTKNIEKVHKEMWDAVKDGNEDAFAALANEMERGAALLSAEWLEVAAMAKIAVEMTEG